MANIRIRPNNIIQYDVCIHGVRSRETSGLKATPVNVKNTRYVKENQCTTCAEHL